MKGMKVPLGHVLFSSNANPARPLGFFYFRSGDKLDTLFGSFLVHSIQGPNRLLFFVGQSKHVSIHADTRCSRPRCSRLSALTVDVLGLAGPLCSKLWKLKDIVEEIAEDFCCFGPPSSYYLPFQPPQKSRLFERV